jgi:hypothetical protein
MLLDPPPTPTIPAPPPPMVPEKAAGEKEEEEMDEVKTEEGVVALDRLGDFVVEFPLVLVLLVDVLVEVK